MSRGTFIDEENLCFVHCAITDKEKITPHYLKRVNAVYKRLRSSRFMVS